MNCSFPDRQPYSSNGESIRYTSPELEKIWKYGFVDVGEVNFQSAAYTARYIMKKITGEPAKDHYRSIDHETGEDRPIQPEYCSMSNGIGLRWYEKYKKDCFPSDEVPVPGHGIIKKVPRYYENRLKEENEQLLEEVKKIRQEFRKTHAEEFEPERLMAKYKVKKAQIGQLKRDQNL